MTEGAAHVFFTHHSVQVDGKRVHLEQLFMKNGLDRIVKDEFKELIHEQLSQNNHRI